MPIDSLGVFLLLINDFLILITNESYYLSIKSCLYLSDGIDIINLKCVFYFIQFQMRYLYFLQNQQTEHHLYKTLLMSLFYS